MFTIYALIDPRNESVRYVGLTEDVYARFSQHVNCNEGNIDKNEWIAELKAANSMLIMRTLEVVKTLEEARECEEAWIRRQLQEGANLLNQGVRAFTYDDFLLAFGNGERPEKRILLKGDAAKQAMKVLRRYPGIGGVELAKRAKISESYARKLVAQQLAEMTV